MTLIFYDFSIVLTYRHHRCGELVLMKVGDIMTAEDIIAYLQAELAEAYELHDQAKGKDAQEALFHMIRATVITHILEEIE